LPLVVDYDGIRDTSVVMAGLADRMREARERTGLSARALDKKADITPGHTTAIESGGRANPAAETLRKLAAALGVSIDWLMTGESPTAADQTGPQPRVANDDAEAKPANGTEG